MDLLNSELGSFFKIFNTLFSEKLVIPPDFVDQFEELMPQITILQTGSTNSWNIEINKEEESKVFFIGNGWFQFVKDNHLTNRDLLVFHLLPNLSFLVVVYGVDGCEKDLSSTPDFHTQPQQKLVLEPKKEDDDADNHGDIVIETKKEEDYNDNNGGTDDISYTVILKKKNDIFVKIPRRIVERWRIVRGEDGSIQVENSEGVEWRVKVTIERVDGRMVLGKEWKTFLKDNNCRIGDKIIFGFNSRSGNLVANVVRDERPRKLFIID